MRAVSRMKQMAAGKTARFLFSQQSPVAHSSRLHPQSGIFLFPRGIFLACRISFLSSQSPYRSATSKAPPSASTASTSGRPLSRKRQAKSSRDGLSAHRARLCEDGSSSRMSHQWEPACGNATAATTCSTSPKPVTCARIVGRIKGLDSHHGRRQPGARKGRFTLLRNGASWYARVGLKPIDR